MNAKSQFFYISRIQDVLELRYKIAKKRMKTFRMGKWLFEWQLFIVHSVKVCHVWMNFPRKQNQLYFLNENFFCSKLPSGILTFKPRCWPTFSHWKSEWSYQKMLQCVPPFMYFCIKMSGIGDIHKTNIAEGIKGSTDIAPISHKGFFTAPNSL